MMREILVQQVRGLAAPACGRAGVELVDVEFVREDGRWFLRLYIDKPGGVTVDDCERVHEEVGRLIDEVDPIAHPYTMEVASPGLDRPLKREADFERFAGQPVDIRTTLPIDGSRRIRGRLLGLIHSEGESPSGDGPLVRVAVAAEGGKVIEVPLEAISRARLAPELDFPNGVKRGGGRR